MKFCIEQAKRKGEGTKPNFRQYPMHSWLSLFTQNVKKLKETEEFKLLKWLVPCSLLFYLNLGLIVSHSKNNWKGLKNSINLNLENICIYNCMVYRFRFNQVFSTLWHVSKNLQERMDFFSGGNENYVTLCAFPNPLLLDILIKLTDILFSSLQKIS